jgi:hypothetical protein
MAIEMSEFVKQQLMGGEDRNAGTRMVGRDSSVAVSLAEEKTELGLSHPPEVRASPLPP